MISLGRDILILVGRLHLLIQADQLIFSQKGGKKKNQTCRFIQKIQNFNWSEDSSKVPCPRRILFVKDFRLSLEKGKTRMQKLIDPSLQTITMYPAGGSSSFVFGFQFVDLAKAGLD